MPLYDYRCPDCGVFEMLAGLEEHEAECVCGNTATRLPYSGVPNLKGETVAKNIPDPHYQQDAAKRELHQTWGDATRSMEMIRSHVREDRQGNKFVDTAAMSRSP